MFTVEIWYYHNIYECFLSKQLCNPLTNNTDVYVSLKYKKANEKIANEKGNLCKICYNMAPSSNPFPKIAVCFCIYIN